MSRRTTLSIATSLESEYVPPHGHNSPSPVIGRFARAYGLTSSCDEDTDNGQVSFNFRIMKRKCSSGFRRIFIIAFDILG